MKLHQILFNQVHISEILLAIIFKFKINLLKGQIKKMPEIFLEIDKHIMSPGITDIPSNNISPMPNRRPNLQVKPEIYLNSLPRSQQPPPQQQQQFYITSTPPATIRNTRNQIGLKPNTNFMNDQIDAQYYTSNPQDIKTVNDSKFYFSFNHFYLYS